LNFGIGSAQRGKSRRHGRKFSASAHRRADTKALVNTIVQSIRPSVSGAIALESGELHSIELNTREAELLRRRKL
jgi:hypothetical protein